MESKNTKSRMAWQLLRVAKPSSWKFRAWPRSKYGEAELQISNVCGIHDGLWLQWWSKLVRNKEDTGVVMSRIWKNMLQLVFSGSGLVTKSSPTLGTQWTVACQAPLSMGFFRHGYWSGLPFPSPGDLPHPGIKPGSPTFADKFLTEWTERSYNTWHGSPAHSPLRVHQLADKFGH